MANLPKVQNAQYGDSAKLEQLGAGRLTNNPAASVQTWKDPTGGRPPETDPVKLATRTPQGQGRAGTQAASPEQIQYQSAFDALTIQHSAVQKWITLASASNAGPLTKSYAMAALKSYRENLLKLRKTTPFFE